jgi:hypothetical protein
VLGWENGKGALNCASAVAERIRSVDPARSKRAADRKMGMGVILR